MRLSTYPYNTQLYNSIYIINSGYHEIDHPMATNSQLIVKIGYSMAKIEEPCHK